MGLDMYLERYPRYKHYTPREACSVNYHLEWAAEIKSLPPEKDWEALNNMCKSREEIGYWRKANAIHKWFVDHVQGGEDDCDYHEEVTEQILLELKGICEEILNNCKLADGEVIEYWDSNLTPHYTSGMVISNPEICEALLPTQSGFFFGDTNYTKYYLDDVKDTLAIVDAALETDFERYAIYYVSSW